VKGQGKGDFEVRYTDHARDDLRRLFDFLLDQAQTAEDFDAAQGVIEGIALAVESHLSRTPFIFRKAAQSPFLRELVIPLGRAGYVALYEIEAGSVVNILALRHQLEDDYH
jgi:plasmid stabilization system protein ParE